MKKIKKMKLPIYLDDDTRVKLKVKCAMERKSITSVVEAMIKKYIGGK